jgi:hypothetical protein
VFFPGRTYDLSPDGKRFLMIKQAAQNGGDASNSQLVVVLNWTDELRRLVTRRRSPGLLFADIAARGVR